MQKIPRPLISLHGDRQLRRLIHEVVSTHRLDLWAVDDWTSLRQKVQSAPASALVVVDPYDGTDGSTVAPQLLDLLASFPSLAVLAAFEVTPDRRNMVLDLGEAGVVQIIDLAEDTTASVLAQRILGARGRPLRLLVEKSLPDDTSASARAILSAASSIVAEGGQGQDLAAALKITPRTLSRWCRKAALPPPKRLLAWMRILQAAEFLDDPDRPVSAVAAACGYAADSSLRLALRRFTGLTPTEMRERGAFDSASVGFLEALEEARAPKKRYRAPSAKKPKLS